MHDARIDILCSTTAVADLLKVQREHGAPTTIAIQSAVRLTRWGRAVRLIQDNRAALAATPNTSLIKLLIKARRWWARLQQGDIDIKNLSEVEDVTLAYITRMLRLAFLAPAVVDGILVGSVLPKVDGAALTAGEPRRVCRRPVDLSYTAKRSSSSMA